MPAQALWPEDGATVPIYYESRLGKLALDGFERPKIDSEFEEVGRAQWRWGPCARARKFS